jgi:hypothetical protein
VTVKAAILAVTPTSTAQAAFAAKGASLSNLLAALTQSAIEMQGLIRQVIADHPNDAVLTLINHPPPTL